MILTKNMAIDYGRAGIRVNAICPGFIDTPMLQGVFAMDGMADVLADITAAHQLGRLGRADEIASARAVPLLGRRVVRVGRRAARRRRLHGRPPPRRQRAHGPRLTRAPFAALSGFVRARPPASRSTRSGRGDVATGAPTRVPAWETAAMPEPDFSTYSGLPTEPVYGPADAERPGTYPYTRGPYASMYRSKLWTMRMFAGFGTAVDTNRRFHDLLAAGGDGLSTAFDLPTLMGRDSDDPLALGEVGKCGVAIDTLADVDDLYRGHRPRRRSPRR